MDNQKMAESIYLAVYGDIDDKAHRASKTTEIVDWLADGDLSGNETVEQLTAYWREYDQAEESA